MRANSRPILTPCASTTVALTPGRDPALHRSRSSGLKLVSMFFFVNFWARQMRVPSPGPIPAPLALPSPPAGPHGGGPLNSESAIVPVPVAVALAPLTRFPLHVRADSDLCEARARGGPAAPPPPRLRPARRSAPASPAPHPLPLPLPPLTYPTPSISTATTPPHNALWCLSSSCHHFPPPTLTQPRTRSYGGFIFFVLAASLCLLLCMICQLS